MNWKTLLVTGLIAVLVAALVLVVYKAESQLTEGEQAEKVTRERIRLLRIVDEEQALTRRILENKIWIAQTQAQFAPAPAQPAPVPRPLVPPTPIDPNKPD